MNKGNLAKITRILTCAMLATVLAACGITQTYPEKASVITPTPRSDSAGAFLSPFTSDEVVAPWVEKGMAAWVGSEVGSFATQEILKNIPFAGLIGDSIGRNIGRAAAIELVGGMDYMRSTTDLSFDNASDLAVYTWVNYEDHPSYNEVISLVGRIYPEFQRSYASALLNAPTYAID